MPKTIAVEVIGVDPPCQRCQLTYKTVEKAAEALKQEGQTVEITKQVIMSREIVKRYGVLVSPALAVNGVVRMMGSVPTVKQAELLLREAARVKKE
jgi:hypothetical protein